MNVLVDVLKAVVVILAGFGAAGLVCAVAAIRTQRKPLLNGNGTPLAETTRPSFEGAAGFDWDDATVLMRVPAHGWKRGDSAWTFEMPLEDFCAWVAGIQEEHSGKAALQVLKGGGDQ